MTRYDSHSKTKNETPYTDTCASKTIYNTSSTNALHCHVPAIVLISTFSLARSYVTIPMSATHVNSDAGLLLRHGDINKLEILGLF